MPADRLLQQRKGNMMKRLLGKKALAMGLIVALLTGTVLTGCGQKAGGETPVGMKVEAPGGRQARL